MLKNVLQEIKKDINCHKSKSRSECMERVIAERLTRSTESYYSDIAKVCEYLLYKNQLRVMRNVTKEI